MAAIQNERDILLQNTHPRVIPILIPIENIEGLPNALKSIKITSTVDSFTGMSGTTTPSTITLTAQKMGGLTGVVSWSVVAGSASLSPSGDNCTVTGSSVLGRSVTIKASVTSSGTTFDAQITLNKFGTLSAQETVNLTNQVTGQLANGNVSGLGALALLNTVNLNTQTTGALNGQTQVTNLGDLAYANAIAANQIGAGQLAAGVIYAGSISADQINAGILTGRQIRTAATGGRIEITPGNPPELLAYDSGGTGSNYVFRIAPGTGPQVAWARATSGGYALRGTQVSGTVAAILAESSTAGECLWAYGSGSGVGLRVQTGTGAGITINTTSAPDIVLTPRSTVPSTKAKGSLFFHSTKGLCQSDGTSWYAIQDGTIVT